MKFETAYHNAKHCSFRPDQIASIQIISMSDYVKDYKDYFVCPECYQAKLAFVNARTPHFRSYPESLHKEGCSIAQEEMDAQTFNGELKNAKETTIAREMDSILITLLSKREKQNNTASKNNLKQVSSHPSKHKKPISKRKRPPRKRIDLPLNDEDFDCYKFFYGDVNLTWEDSSDGTYKKILLFSPETKKLLCKIKVTNLVYFYIPEEYKQPKKFSCHIVFLAKIPYPLNDRSYYSCFLQLGQYIKLVKI